MKPRLSFHSRGGSALVTTLLVIVVLTIIVTAFLQSMSLERKTAHSYLNRTRAELAARAGLAETVRRMESATGKSMMRFTVATEKPNTEDEYLELLPLITDTDNKIGVDETKRAPLSSQVAPTDGTGGETGESFLLDITPEGQERTKRKVTWQTLKDEKQKEIGRYAFWVDAASSKQDARVHAGVKDELTRPQPDNERDALQTLAELPLVTAKGDVFPESESKALQDYQYFKAKPSERKDLLTPKTINQIATIDPAASNRDFTLDSPTAQLTPEGKPKLNIQRLKCYIDGDTWKEYGEGTDDEGTPIVIAEDNSYEGKTLSVDQGPNSERFKLISKLLNEDDAEGGPYPAEKLHPWGYGNFEIVKRIFPERDANGKYIQARQFVANLIDYIDSDIIPTTDGMPGIQPAGGDVSGPHPTQQAYVIPNTPANMPAPPTVLGVEARLEKPPVATALGVRGHPYITYVGQGFIWNAASTRVLGFLGMGYPWSNPARLGKNDVIYYQAEMQVSFSGTASGSRGPDITSENSDSPKGYILHGWLAQESNFDGKYNGASFKKESYILFPRGLPGSSAFDLGNGYFSSGNPSSITFTNLVPKIEVLRLIYKDFVPSRAGKRYLVQDLSILGSDPSLARPPITFKPSATYAKVGETSYNNTFKDWYFLGDPRLNFRAAGWTLANTKEPANSSSVLKDGVLPVGNSDIYKTPENKRKDPIQGMGAATNRWYNTAQDHFPVAIDTTKSNIGYRPSPSGGEEARFYGDPVEPAMLSYAELGFIHAGAPWQTLTLFNDPSRFNDADRDHADWRLLDYVDIGSPPRHLDLVKKNPQREVYGQINVNAGNRATLIALLKNIDGINTPSNIADALIKSTKRPFLTPSDVFSEVALKNDLTSDADREKLVGQIYPALTAHSQKFTIYTVGEARDQNPDGTVRTVSHVTLATDVELRLQEKSDGTQVVKPIVLRTYTP